jgi:hypothetical protein
MKENTIGFRHTFRKFKTSAKNVSCSVKVPLIWNLLEEYMEKDEESIDFVRERWYRFTTTRHHKMVEKLKVDEK